MFCKYCGAAVADDAAFCQKCGGQVNGEVKPEVGRIPVTPTETPTATPVESQVTQEKIFSKEGLLSLKGRRNRKPYILLGFGLALCCCLTAMIEVALFLMAFSVSESWVYVLGLIFIISIVLSLLFIRMSIANAAKRLHDVGHSAWWILVPFMTIYIMFKEGVEGPNQYGPNPLAGK